MEQVGGKENEKPPEEKQDSSDGTGRMKVTILPCLTAL